MPTDNEFTRILQWPGYRVYQHQIDEKNKILELWVRRKRGNRKLECSGCGRKFPDAYDNNERAVRDLPWSEFKITVHIEVYSIHRQLERRSREFPNPSAGHSSAERLLQDHGDALEHAIW